MVGYAMLSLSAVGSISSYINGKLVKYVGRLPLIIGGKSCTRGNSTDTLNEVFGDSILKQNILNPSGADPGGGAKGALAPPPKKKKLLPQIVRRGSRGAKRALPPPPGGQEGLGPPLQNPGSAYARIVFMLAFLFSHRAN